MEVKKSKKHIEIEKLESLLTKDIDVTLRGSIEKRLKVLKNDKEVLK